MNPTAKHSKAFRINVRFTHSVKNKNKYAEISDCFFIDEEASSGPIVERGQSSTICIEPKNGDVYEFSTRKFDNEYDIKIWRRGKLLNLVRPKKDRKK